MEVDWHSLFGISQPVLETVVRGSSVYWFLFLLFRLVVRRDVGAIGLADILVLVIVADAAQNAMAGEYKSITDGFILIATIVFWNYLLDWLAFKYPKMTKLLEPPPLQLIISGKIIRQNLRRERLAESELMAKLREKGVENLTEVKSAHMESDGSISVIKWKEANS